MSNLEPDQDSSASEAKTPSPGLDRASELSRTDAMPDRLVVDATALSTAPVTDYAAFIIRQWSFRVDVDRDDEAMLRVTPRPTENFEAFVQELQTVLQNHPFDGNPGKFVLEPITEGQRFRHHVCVRFCVDPQNSDLQLVSQALSATSHII